MSKESKKIRILFAFYCLILTAIVLLKFNPATFSFSLEKIPGQAFTNWVPFHSISEFMRILAHQPFNPHALLNLFGNILIFMPWGLLFPQIYRGDLHLSLTLLSGILVSALFEGIQYVTQLGVLDVDDVILNTLGVFAGLLIYLVLKIIGKV